MAREAPASILRFRLSISNCAEGASDALQDRPATEISKSATLFNPATRSAA